MSEERIERLINDIGAEFYEVYDENGNIRFMARVKARNKFGIFYDTSLENLLQRAFQYITTCIREDEE